uniref:Uncharacterized protein n=1 Tax=Gasterosteus aculeatus TaxID=69293 RepID=G3PVE1_GASAC
MLRGGMAEEILNDSLADLREVENKVGRKTPESLLIWMRDAADCGDGWWSDVVDRGDRSSAFGQSFSDKLRGLKQEMMTDTCVKLAAFKVAAFCRREDS